MGIRYNENFWILNEINCKFIRWLKIKGMVSDGISIRDRSVVIRWVNYIFWYVLLIRCIINCGEVK